MRPELTAAVVAALSALAVTRVSRPLSVAVIATPAVAVTCFAHGGGVAAAAAFVALAGVVAVDTARQRAAMMLSVAGVSAMSVSAMSVSAMSVSAMSVSAVGVGDSPVAAVVGVWLVAAAGGLLCDTHTRAAGVAVGLWAALAGLTVLLTDAAGAEGMSASLREVVGEQFAYRVSTPLTAAVWIGLLLWPLAGAAVVTSRRGGPGIGFVPPLLSLASVALIVRTGGVTHPWVATAGLVTMPVAAVLCLAQSDLRGRLTAAHAATLAYAAVVLVYQPAAFEAAVVTAALSAAVGLGVVSRLERRYATRETAAFRGLARRHPSGSFLLAGSGLGLIATLAGPLAIAAVMPAVAAASGRLMLFVAAVGLLLTAAIAATLTSTLFGRTRVPEFRGPVFQRIGITPRRHGPLVGVGSMIAWAACLLAAALAATGRTTLVQTGGSSWPSAAASARETGRSSTNSAPSPESPRSRTLTPPLSRRASVDTM